MHEIREKQISFGTSVAENQEETPRRKEIADDVQMRAEFTFLK